MSNDTGSGPPAATLGSDHGTLVLVVGASGVGKDTLIDHARRILAGDPRFVFATRTITRPADAGGEAHAAMDAAEFALAEARGDFALTWRAHGLAYGVPRMVLDHIAAGDTVIVNASRGAVAAAHRLAPKVEVVHVTAPPEALAGRLAHRGREDATAIALRLAREMASDQISGAIEIRNDTTIEAAGARFIAVLREIAGLNRAAPTR